MKERIIGAAVLVLVVVLVVPVFLDGAPGDGEIVSTYQPLPGQADHQNKTVVLDRDRTEPVPSSSSSEPEQSMPEAKQVTVQKQFRPVAKPLVSQPVPQEPVAQDPLPTASSTGMWAVQLGSFRDKANAERLAANLRKQDFAAFLSQSSRDSESLHRVRIGPQKDRDSAEVMAERLAKAGHKGQVVPHP